MCVFEKLAEIPKLERDEEEDENETPKEKNETPKEEGKAMDEEEEKEEEQEKLLGEKASDGDENELMDGDLVGIVKDEQQ